MLHSVGAKHKSKSWSQHDRVSRPTRYSVSQPTRSCGFEALHTQNCLLRFAIVEPIMVPTISRINLPVGAIGCSRSYCWLQCGVVVHPTMAHRRKQLESCTLSEAKILEGLAKSLQFEQLICLNMSSFMRSVFMTLL